MKRLSLSLTFVLVVLSSLQAAETVRTAWDHETDFSALKTYGWMGGQQPLPNEANHIRVTEAIERAMERKGFQKAAFEDAQVLLLYRAGIQQQVGAQSYQTVSTYDPTAVKTMMGFPSGEKRHLDCRDVRRGDAQDHLAGRGEQRATKARQDGKGHRQGGSQSVAALPSWEYTGSAAPVAHRVA